MYSEGSTLFPLPISLQSSCVFLKIEAVNCSEALTASRLFTLSHKIRSIKCNYVKGKVEFYVAVLTIAKLVSIFCDEQALLKFVQTLIYLATFALLTQGRQYISISV